MCDIVIDIGPKLDSVLLCVVRTCVCENLWPDPFALVICNKI